MKQRAAGGMANESRFLMRHSTGACAVLFLLGVMLSLVLTACIERREIQLNRQAAFHAAEVHSARIEALMDSLFHKTDVLESIIISSHGEVSEETFQDLAASLSNGSGIRAIQYLPDGVVTYCYPRQGNEKAIGGNVFENPKRREDALQALRTGEIALSGPYELTQGGFGLVARNPIYLTDAGGEARFWGFAVIILDLPEALNPIILPELEANGYRYQLYCISETGERDVIARSKDALGSDSVNCEIHVPNRVWTLSLSPARGWINWKTVAYVLAAGLCVSALSAVIACQALGREKRLRQSAAIDDLTGVFNRRRMMEYMDIRCRDKTMPFALLYLDLDRFKEINDTLGHANGDRYLVETASRIRRSLAAFDSIGRIGGDEFIAVLEHESTDEGCRRAIQAIRAALEVPLTLGGVKRKLRSARALRCFHRMAPVFRS